MKLKNIYTSLIFGSLLLMAGGCNDDLFDADGHWTGKIPDEVTVNIVVPDPQVVNIGNTRSEDIDIKTLNVLLLKEDGSVIDNIEYGEGKNPFTYDAEKNIGTLTIPLTQDTKNIQVVANAQTQMASENDPSKIVVDDDELYLWGQNAIGSIMDTGTVRLIRNTGMVTIELDEGVTNFEVLEVGVFGTADKGTVGPNTGAAYYNSTTGLTIKAFTPTGVTYPYSDDCMETWNPEDGVHSIAGLYETPAGITNGGKSDIVRVIIRGRYTDADRATAEGYYVVALKERTEADNTGFSETEGHFSYGDVLDILRNHKYKIKITEVRAEGWPNLAQAKTALPDNRITQIVTDEAPEITDIEATRDYYLGVGADVEANYNGKAEIDITTSYKDFANISAWKDALVFTTEDDEWIKISPESGIEFKEVGSNQVKVSIPLEENVSARSRYSYITVRAGKLTRTVTVTQLGCPYNRRRKVTVTGIPGLDVSQYGYYSFMDGKRYDEDGNEEPGDVDLKIQGLDAASNRGADRNGLHFPIVPLYTGVKYIIPKDRDADIDAKITLGSDVFKVSDDANNWYVELVDENTIKSSEGRLSITTKNGDTEVTVEYKLLRTGIFHQLTSAEHQVGESSAQKTGWFYYELTKVGGVYILDRDLGASSNLPYAPGSVDYKNNRSAIGGYFKVNDGRWSDWKKDITRFEDQETITAKLGLVGTGGKFVPATETDYLNMKLDAGTIVSANAPTSRVAEGKIYFSKAGYYEGTDFKDPSRCKLWTRTYLAGTQGMDVKASEYGYWYRYYDDGKSTNPENRFSNIRMARGSDGATPTSNSIWRYMPLRLVWVNSECKNPEGANEGDEEQIVRNKMVIYFETTNPWNPIKYYAWNVNPTVAEGWNNWPTPEKVAQDGTTTLYRAEIGIPQNGEAGIIFKYGEEHQKYQTEDYKGLKAQYDKGNTVIWLRQKDMSDASKERWNYEVVDYGNVESLVTNNFGGGVTPPTPTTTYTYQLKLGGETVNFSNNQITNKVLTNGSTTIEVIEKATTGSDTKTEYYNNKFNGPALDKDVAFTTGSSSWSLAAGTYNFTINPTNKTLKVEKVTVPTDKVLYTPGTASNWFGTTPMYITTADNGTTYEGVVYLENGEFKFSTALNWTSDNYGKGSEDGKLQKGGSTNISVSENGFYWLKVDLSNSNDPTYKMEIIRSISAIGGFNGWNGDSALTNSTANSDYSSKKAIWSGTVDFSGDGKWKLRANNDWGEVDWGAKTDNDTWNGNSKVVEIKGKDILDPGSGKYKVTLDLTTLPFKITCTAE